MPAATAELEKFVQPLHAQSTVDYQRMPGETRKERVQVLGIGSPAEKLQNGAHWPHDAKSGVQVTGG